MRRLLPLFGFLTLLLVLWSGGSAHAAEALECAPVAEASAHFEGDGDEVPPDSDSPVPHHHGGCHGHHANLVPGTSSDRVVAVDEDALTLTTTRDFMSTEPDLALRPPIA